jgi:hypothetical protein
MQVSREILIWGTTAELTTLMFGDVYSLGVREPRDGAYGAIPIRAGYAPRWSRAWLGWVVPRDGPPGHPSSQSEKHHQADQEPSHGGTHFGGLGRVQYVLLRCQTGPRIGPWLNVRSS